ncbi:MAG: helix-turn-helix domain-containing protein [Phaeospirillum sp.]|nr:helix-turn-helix domain-containing protein [Phaeospirillum sp.]
MREAAKNQDDARREAPQPQSPAAWTAIAETADENRAKPSGPLRLRQMAERLRSLGRRIAAGSWADRLGLWRAVLDQAAKTLHFPEVTAQAPMQALPQATPPPPAEPLDPAHVRAKVESIMARLPPRGDPTIPANLQSLGRLLTDCPPTDDFNATDMLHDCFPRGTRNSDSRVLMAIARNLTRAFGRSGRLPLTSGKAWTMIDPELFSEELAAQLAAICSFVLNWQATEKDFLILEFAEVELIEYLFENLHPRRHAGLMIKVMDFKVLSLRRMGLLRRIPARIRRRIHNAHGANPAGLRDYVDDTIALLDYFARPESFSAVAAAARTARAELEKIATHLAGAAPPEALSATAPLHPVMRGLGTPQPSQPLPSRSVATAEPAPPRQMTPPEAPTRRRFTKKQKTEAVMRLLQGEERDWVAISMGVGPALLTRWQDAFLNGGSAALAPTAKARDSREPSVDDLKDKLHALIRTVEQLSNQMSQTPATLALPAPPPEAKKPAKAALALPPPAPPAKSRRGKRSP